MTLFTLPLECVGKILQLLEIGDLLQVRAVNHSSVLAVQHACLEMDSFYAPVLVHNRKGFTGVNITSLVSMGCFGLAVKKLHLSNLRNLHDRDLKILHGRMPVLRYVDISGCVRIGNEGVANLFSPSLQELIGI